jgi:hypothetical protein
MFVGVKASVDAAEDPVGENHTPTTNPKSKLI